MGWQGAGAERGAWLAVIPACLDTELTEFPLRMRDWLKNVLITLYERDEDNNLLTEKQKLKVRAWGRSPAAPGHVHVHQNPCTETFWLPNTKPSPGSFRFPLCSRGSLARSPAERPMGTPYEAPRGPFVPPCPSHGSPTAGEEDPRE